MEAKIKSFILWNIKSQSLVKSIDEDDIFISELSPDVTFGVDAEGGQSVLLNLNYLSDFDSPIRNTGDRLLTRSENVFPYCIAGDYAKANFDIEQEKVYELQAIVMSEKEGLGERLAERRFRIFGSSPDSSRLVTHLNKTYVIPKNFHVESFINMIEGLVDESDSNRTIITVAGHEVYVPDGITPEKFKSLIESAIDLEKNPTKPAKAGDYKRKKRGKLWFFSKIKDFFRKLRKLLGMK